MPDKPVTRRLFDVAERAVGGPLESVVQTELFADAFAALVNAESSVRDVTERFSRRLLHALNIPAGSDVRRLEVQLSRLERTLEVMRQEMAPPRGGERILDGEDLP